jgi:hypothetical protein
MSYDQHGKHSTWEFGVQSVERGLARLPAHVLTMGLPFYSRSVKDGDWKTYEELVKTFPKKCVGFGVRGLVFSRVWGVGFFVKFRFAAYRCHETLLMLRARNFERVVKETVQMGE